MKFGIFFVSKSEKLRDFHFFRLSSSIFFKPLLLQKADNYLD